MTTRWLVTFDHTRITEDLTDFPVSVNVGDLEGFSIAATPLGGDIRCFSGSTELAREVVILGGSAIAVWIKASLSSTVDTPITIEVDGSRLDYAITDPYGAQAVWSSDFVSVYHLDTDPTVDLPDSASGYSATPSTTNGSQNYGVFGASANFDGTTTDSASTAGIVAGSAPRTMSAWIYATAGSGNLSIWSQGDDAPGELWEMMRYSGNLILHAYGGGFDTISVSAPIADETVAYCAITYDGTDVLVYLDGALMGTVPMTLATGSAFNNLGGPGYFGQWNGVIDEARLSSVVRSAGWLAAEFASYDTGSFYVAEKLTAAADSGWSVIPDIPLTVDGFGWGVTPPTPPVLLRQGWSVQPQGGLSLSGDGALVVAGYARVPVTLGLSSTGSLSVAGMPRVPVPLALSGAGTLSLAPSPKVPTPVALAGAGALAVSGLQRYPGPLPLAGAGVLGIVGVQRYSTPVDLLGAGTLGVSGLQRYTTAVPLSGAGALSVAPMPKVPVPLNLSGIGLLGVAPVPKVPVPLGLSGAGSLLVSGHLPQVFFDNAVDGGSGAVTTRTWTHTLAGNCVVIMFCNSTNTTSVCTFGGVTIPKLYGPVTGGNYLGVYVSYVSVFALVSNSLPQGAQTVSCTQGGSASSGGSVSFSSAGSIGTVITDTASGNLSKSTVTGYGRAAVAGYTGGANNFGTLSPNQNLNYNFNAFVTWGALMGWGLDTGSGISFSATHSTSKAGALIPILP